MPGLCFARNWTSPPRPRLQFWFSSCRNSAPGLVALSDPCVYSCLLFTATQDITAFVEIRRSSPLTPLLGGFTTLRKATISFVIFVCPPVHPSARNTSAPTARIFIKFHYIWRFFENLSKKFTFHLKSDKNTGYFTWRPIFVISPSILLEMRNVSEESCRENQNTFRVQ